MPTPLAFFRARFQRRQHQQRHNRGARPVRHLVQMKRKPQRQQHDLDRQYRHAAPGQHPEHRQHEAGENIAVHRAAAREHRLASPRHMRRIDGIADHLQREIGFHGGAHFEGAVLHQRPAAMRALDPAQIVGDLAFQHAVDRLAQIVAQQHVFRRDGAVGFELEHPMSVGLPQIQQRTRGSADARLQRGVGLHINCSIVGTHLARHPQLFASGHHIQKQVYRKTVRRSGLPHRQHQIGGAVARPHRSLDGGRQPRISPVAGEKQVF